jgi:hypothetical protein
MASGLFLLEQLSALKQLGESKNNAQYKRALKEASSSVTTALLEIVFNVSRNEQFAKAIGGPLRRYFTATDARQKILIAIARKKKSDEKLLALITAEGLNYLRRLLIAVDKYFTSSSSK